MIVGVLQEQPWTDHQNSLVLSNRGDLIVNGEIAGSGIGFKEGDLVTMEFNESNLSIKVNLGGMGFTNQFRWADSLTDERQAVKHDSGLFSRRMKIVFTS
jgi:hypothetical protein